MNTSLVARGALATGGLTLATTSLLPDTTAWEIALSFPVGAVTFLVGCVVLERCDAK